MTKLNKHLPLEDAWGPEVRKALPCNCLFIISNLAFQYYQKFDGNTGFKFGFVNQVPFFWWIIL